MRVNMPRYRSAPKMPSRTVTRPIPRQWRTIDSSRPTVSPWPLSRSHSSSRRTWSCPITATSPRGRARWTRRATVDFPEADPAYLVADTVTAVVQVKGKVRARLDVAPDISEADLEALALESSNVQRALGGAGVRKVIVKAPKLVNIVPEA